VTIFHDIAKSLLDRDGACRDLNFESPTWDGVGKLVNSLTNNIGEISGTDLEGKALTIPYFGSAIAEAQQGRPVLLFLNNGQGPIKKLQVFICSGKDGEPFVEMTFFSEDVNQTDSLGRDFIAWAQEKQLLLGARRYYARYENASWHFGDTGEHSGVFLVFDDAEKSA
jgi:hypothetical protein